MISGIFTIFTNSILLFFILTNKKLKSSKHIIICSTLITGILFAACYILPRFTFLLSNGQDEWPQDFRCGMLSRFGIAIFFSLNIHLIMRIMEMYIQICHPFQSQHILTIRNIAIMIFLVWIITLSIPVGFQIYFELKSNLTNIINIKACNTLSNHILIIFSIILAVFSAVVLVISASAYAKIVYIAKSSRQRMRQYSYRTNSTTDSSTAHPDTHYQDVNKRNVKGVSKLGKIDKSLTQTLSLFIFYLLAIMPFLVLVIYTQLYYNAFTLRRWPKLLVLVFRYCQYVAFLFPAFQPVLFALFTADIRKAVACHVCGCCFKQLTTSPSGLPS